MKDQFINIMLYNDKAGDMEHIAEAYLILYADEDKTIEDIHNVDYSKVTNDNDMFDTLAAQGFWVSPRQLEMTNLVEIVLK